MKSKMKFSLLYMIRSKLKKEMNENDMKIKITDLVMVGWLYKEPHNFHKINAKHKSCYREIRITIWALIIWLY